MKICYINFKLDNPRDQITLRGLRENGVDVTEIADKTPGWRKYVRIARAYRASRDECDVVMVGYAGSVLVIFMWLLIRKPLIYNTLATFVDSMIISRFSGAFFSLSSFRYYVTDFVAFHVARRSFLECEAQKEMVMRYFGVSAKKLSVHYVGTDDTEFYFDPAIPKLPQFTVVFRGMFLAEAGADVVVRAAKELERENVPIRLIGRGLLLLQIEALVAELKPTNLELISTRLPIEDLRRMMLECHLSLGQLADHPRVETTIPHKAFESMSMKLPYLTGANRGVLEVLDEGQTCFTVPPGDHHALARKILELRDRPRDLERVAENAYQLYQKECTPRILAKKILDKLAEI
ncbi:MAG: glycosyltransferase family 4 protein [bacterium]|nr:glycosyltransferase family 4 protein [bacterium]